MDTLTQDNCCSTARAETARRTSVPRYEIAETKDAFIVTANVPGVDKANLTTEVDGERLTVVGRREWTPPEGWTAVYQETPRSDFRLVLELDERVNRDAVRAELNQGVLTLTLPKAEALKPRRIDIEG